MITALKMSAPQVTKSLLEIDFASNNHQWETVLRAASGLPAQLYADYANQDVNQALYHLGRLPDEMFSYPQWRLFCDHGFGARGRMFSRKAFDLLLELGRVNEAEVIAHNDFEGHPSAVFLMRIARTKIVKGENDAARLYLNVLRDDLCYGSWAAGLLAADPGGPGAVRTGTGGGEVADDHGGRRVTDPGQAARWFLVHLRGRHAAESAASATRGIAWRLNT